MLSFSLVRVPLVRFNKKILLYKAGFHLLVGVTTPKLEKKYHILNNINFLFFFRVL